MNIGDKIIREIGRAALFQTLDHNGQEIKSGLIYVWQSCAAEQIEAVVEAHIEERVRIRLGQYTVTNKGTFPPAWSILPND